MLRSLVQSVAPRASTSRIVQAAPVLPACVCSRRSASSSTAAAAAAYSSAFAVTTPGARHASTSTTQDSASTPLSKYSLLNGMTLEGTVTKTGVMQKTATVTVERQAINKKTLTPYKLHRKYLCHDADEKTVVGDTVSIRHCKPVSRRKHFEIVRVVKGARERAVMDDAPTRLAEEDSA